MFRMQRPNPRPSRPRERVDIKLSNFQAIQVPKGWDRLSVSLISVETGKAIAKLGKALVRNGSCQWTETLSESIYMSSDGYSKGYEDCHVKLLVSLGTARSSILGELPINVAQFASSRASSAVSQPLKKCSYGTVLQLKIQCLTRRSKVGEEELRNSKSWENDMNTMDVPDPDRKSDISHASSRSLSEDITTNARPMKLDSRGTTQSPSGSVQSLNSMEESTWRENLSGKNASREEGSTGRREILSLKNVSRGEEYDSQTTEPGGSYVSSPIPDDYSGGDDSPLNHPTINSRAYLGEDLQNEAAVVSKLSTVNNGSSRTLLDAAEDTIEELRAEAKMWERNARKLMIDLDISRKEFSDLSKKQAALVVEHSAAYAEHDVQKQEVEKLKAELRNLMRNQATQEESFTQTESWIQIQKALENEIKHQQELNGNLVQQLRQSQESNIALVSVLQELEKIVEQQKLEIENLSSHKVNFASLDDYMAEKSEDNATLVSQLHQFQESEKKLQGDVQLLEETLRDKIEEQENERKLNSETLFSIESDYKNRVSAKEEEIVNLEASLSENLKVSGKNNADHITEIESLRIKVQELERDCAELTDENLELLYKLKVSNKADIRKSASSDSMSSDPPNVSHSDGSEVSNPKYQISHLEEELNHKISENVPNDVFKSSEHLTEILKEINMAFHLVMKSSHLVSCDEREASNDVTNSSEADTTNRMSSEYILSSLQELNKLLGTWITESEETLRISEINLNQKNDMVVDAEMKMRDALKKVQELEELKVQSKETNANIMKELDQKRSELDVIGANLVSKEQEINFLLNHQRELDADISELQQNMLLVVGERDAYSDRVENLQNELVALHSTISSHVSAINSLKRNSEELERRKGELESTLKRIHEENVQLQESIFDQEAQVKQLAEENRIHQQERESFKSVIVRLEDENRKLKVGTDTQILDLEQKLEDMKQQFFRAQEERSYLETENERVQESVRSFVQENMELQKLNSELRRANEQLENNCSRLVAQLSDSKKSLSGCKERIESLEDQLTSVLDDLTMRENNLKLEIDALVKENSNQKEKLAQEESLQQIILGKTTEVESLQKDVELLTRQLTDACNERERASFEASGEVSLLLEGKAELQASLQEVQFRAQLAENRLNSVMQESELNVQDLTGRLAASQQSHARLMADHDRIQKMLANYKKKEENLKTNMNDLELKLTISDYERQQLTKEIGILKSQLQSMSTIQDEITNLRSELEGCRLDKGKLEQALKAISVDYDELRVEKTSFFEKVCVLQEAMTEFEECKRNKLALEEKIQQVEKELNDKEILCIQNADLKNEITEIKRANVQFQQKMYMLEEERDECLKKAQILEEDLKAVKERNIFQNEGANYHGFHDGGSHGNGDHKASRQLDDNEISEECENQSITSKKQAVSGELVTSNRYERTKSSLQAELRDLRDRYLQMSLKYAEVEAQREDLVMKLRATRGGRRLFS